MAAARNSLHLAGQDGKGNTSSGLNTAFPAVKIETDYVFNIFLYLFILHSSSMKTNALMLDSGEEGGAGESGIAANNQHL